MTDVAQAAAIVRRVLPAPPGAVYDEWLDPEAFADWMCPLPARCSRVVMEPWVGGSLRIDIEESGTEFYVIGSYTDLQRPSRLSFTWNCSTWPPATRDSVVTVTFEPIGADQTVMTIEHTLLRPDFVDEHTRGWATIADQLDTRLRTRAGLRP